MSLMGGILDIEEAPLNERLHQDIYVEPRDRLESDEDHRQMAFVSAMRRDAPHIAVHATPNGGRQSDWARIRGAKMGVYSGWPDLECDWADGSAHIEFKDGAGNPRPDQVECLNRLHRMGKHVAVCRTKDGALAWLKSIGAPL